MSKITDLHYIKKILPEIVKRLISFEGVQKIIVFGSIIEKKQTPDSDLDLIIVKESIKDRYRDMVDMRKSLRGLEIPIDVLVIDELDFNKRILSPSNAYYWANKSGKVIYDSI